MDLGTTYCAAAISRNGVVEPVLFSHGTSTVPTAVWVGPDGERLVGEAALRRGLREPERLAREFKRRLGDDVPLVLGGTPVSADQLMTTMLASVLEQITAEQGEAPATVALTHPANWGSFRKEIFENAVKAAGVAAPVLLSEPEAAATHYAATGRVDEGDVVAVYDLGGGTFDIAIMRRAGDQFVFLGDADGVERLGGIDFDTAVYGHVSDAVGGLPSPTDADTRAALLRLRQECTQAKEALSADSEAHITVDLPDRHEVVRINRSEFEAMIRPSVLATIDAVRRVLGASGIAADDVSKVLLVGGSSRIPLVAELLGGELGRTVAVDTHPKMAVALGAARAAASAASPQAAPDALAVPPPAPTPVPTRASSPAAEAATPTSSAAADPGRSRRGLLIGAAVAVVAVAVIAVVALGGGDDAGTAAVDTTAATTVAPEPTTVPSSTPDTTTAPTDGVTTVPPVVRTITLEAAPEGLAARFGKVWVGTRDGVIHAYDPATGEETFQAKIDESFDDIVATDDAIWATSANKVHRIDPATGAVSFTAVVEGKPEGIAADGTAVIIAVQTAGGGTVRTVDASTGLISDVATLPAAPIDAALADGVAWVLGDTSLFRVDLATGDVARYEAGGKVDGVVAEGSQVWITLPVDGKILVLDSTTLEQQQVLDITDPSELAFESGFVWVSRPGPALATAIDPATYRPVADIHTGAGPDRMSVLDGRIWVSNVDDRSVTAANAEVG